MNKLLSWVFSLILVVASCYITPDLALAHTNANLANKFTTSESIQIAAISSEINKDYNCDDFANQEEAQAIFEEYSQEGDIFNLDHNNNGIACDSLLTSTFPPCVDESKGCNCSNFLIQEEAQAVYDHFLDQGDIFGLDRDHDNKPCESLPKAQPIT
ncbi:MAG TPA: hypothetical protein DCF68_10560 [Cyanothece sp. UBA12306]|nr:hypothetical protein [Cyanothece sp. UBA12306]